MIEVENKQSSKCGFSLKSGFSFMYSTCAEHAFGAAAEESKPSSREVLQKEEIKMEKQACRFAI